MLHGAGGAHDAHRPCPAWSPMAGGRPPSLQLQGASRYATYIPSASRRPCQRLVSCCLLDCRSRRSNVIRSARNYPPKSFPRAHAGWLNALARAACHLEGGVLSAPLACTAPAALDGSIIPSAIGLTGTVVVAPTVLFTANQARGAYLAARCSDSASPCSSPPSTEMATRANLIGACANTHTRAPLTLQCSVHL